MTATNFAKESGHWYQKDGTPAYTIIGANGKERNTNLRDARKHGFVPSVTTIMNKADKPGLNKWKVNQAVLSALTLTREKGESDESFLKRVNKDAQEVGRIAREKGTEVHGYCELGIAGKKVPKKGQAYYELVKAELDKHFPEDTVWNVEKSFGNDMYGGKCDLSKYVDATVLDIKTHEKDIDTVSIWPDQYMQLAAYVVGLGMNLETTKCGILSVNHVDMQARLLWADQKKIIKGWAMFSALMNFWYADTQLGA